MNAGEGGWASLFWTTFNRSRSAMFVAHLDRALVAVNAALTELFGIPAEMLVGKRVDQFVDPSNRDQMLRDWAGLRVHRRCSGERLWRTPAGRRFHVQYAAHVENVTGQDLVLYVVIDTCERPMKGATDPRDQLQPLTARETEVVSRLALGARVHEIADQLFLAESTVRTHARNAMTKLGARSQAQLVATALATGMLDPEVILEHLGEASELSRR